MSIREGLSVEVIEISSSSTYDDEDECEDSDDDEEEEVQGPRADVSPNSVVVKTEKEKMIDDDDCYILDYNPFETVTLDLEKKLALVSNGDPEDEDDDDDITILAEKGEVACRDFPHSRHLCSEFLFDKTSHESHCPQCYCYVCDTPAPCTRWKGSLLSHCHASDRLLMWKELRSVNRKPGVKLDSSMGSC